MKDQSSNPVPAVTRRQFIKSSSLAAASAATVVNFPSILHADTKPDINAVIIGVGGRGGGAGKDFVDAVKVTGVNGKIGAVACLCADQARPGKDRSDVQEEQCLS